MAKSYLIPLRFIILIWVIFFIDLILPVDFSLFGIIPRTVYGLLGILTSPLIHGGWGHIISNTFPLFVLGTVLFMFYKKEAGMVFILGYLLTNVLVWIFARPASHIGASGLIYALAGFLISIGLFRKDIKSILISVVILILYGGMVYGVFPVQKGVSWESHLLGAITGVLMASSVGRNRNYN